MITPGRTSVYRSDVPFLKIRDLAINIGDTPVLHAVSLSVRPGEVVGLLGPNGAGKTTTMAAALGLLPKRSGETRLFDQDPSIAGPAIRRRVGILPDRHGFYDWMTALDYLTLFANLYGSPLTPQTATDLLDRVGLAPHRRQPIGAFSHGMRQRLGLARALVPIPKLLLLDERTNGLDPQGRRTIHDILVSLALQGVGILLCTHLLDDVERLCHRIALIVEGRTVAEGKIEELLHTHAFDRRFRLRLGMTP
ncbi:ABC transporter ATP-binding protein [Azospirillum sp. TSA2s]|uniref:ABC transporter ATP-binding protein n=1 Tax=Azospirillum sp. TSA2s TaxID=709810 RepID=UPI001FFF1962|nr:ABC transporter ATP-binding protein [Azospirillum sp. TSA2s]